MREVPARAGVRDAHRLDLERALPRLALPPRQRVPVRVVPQSLAAVAGTREPRVDTPRTRRGRVSRVRASSRQTCAGPGTLRGPVCRVPASSRQTCAGRVHMDLLLAGIRELGSDECHHWLDHVRNCQTCTGPFVKTLIARLVYLVLCGIRLIPHGTRLARVCIFRYTWAGSCHGWNSYGTRRPRVCGIPCVTSSRVPAGGMPGTLLPPVYGTPANWGQACAAGRLPVLVWPEFRATVQTRGRSVPARRFPVLVGPEFTDPLQTRGRSVPTARPAPSPPARPASWTSPPDAVRSMSCISRPRARVGGTRTHTRAIMGASCNSPTTTPARTPARPPRGRVTQTPAGALDPNAGGITCQ